MKKGLFYYFKPDLIVDSLKDINVLDLINRGIKFIAVDLDNTLVPYLEEEIPKETYEWVEKVKSLGLEVYIFSNASLARVAKIGCMLGLSGKGKVFKPIIRNLRQELQKRGLTPTQGVLIGDQVFTDVLIGKIEGVFTILVKPSSRKDFLFTKINRFLEKLLRRYLHA
ncbi:MAG: hypothetical protein DDT40_00049 [candidate division WS2 bacterium]|uniref:YqeG family HAD IIIA-type phosphatase n=1 Tax=Psychracetigena formicireducens TaxID=2986056 RepID=A0A9E2BI83_PSYF1|nr:hypothetical protein [Candidatus Psychracetigena formicireducens]MBT9144625.1 hypothetical protein [Candidatus Psychracetigena formicireducens]MBT9149885.1 hypothetical protein [Candidatus Psychracetigena formicireducens]